MRNGSCIGLSAITAKINLPKNIAKHIVAAREQAPIRTTGELTEIIRGAIPMKIQATGGHPAKRTFQAIRIELNRELDVLRDSLDGMIDLLDDGGRICIITFHSLEDRIVKTIFRKNENPCTCPPEISGVRVRTKAKGQAHHKKAHRFGRRRTRRESPCPQRQAARRGKVLTTAENTQKKGDRHGQPQRAEHEIPPL